VIDSSKSQFAQCVPSTALLVLKEAVVAAGSTTFQRQPQARLSVPEDVPSSGLFAWFANKHVRARWKSEIVT